MKLALMGLKGHHGAVLKGAIEYGGIEGIAVSDDDRHAVDSMIAKTPLFKGAQGYEHWRHLYEHTMMDLCCVGDESGVRFEQLTALFERGVHVVSEKPLVTTLKDLETLRATFVKSASKLTMLLELRHQPKNVRVREIVQGGGIGEVCQVSTQKSYKWGERPKWLQSRERLGGTIPFIGIHSIDTLCWITGLDLTHIAAFHGRIGQPEAGETENHASILAQLSNGASVTARLDYLRPQAAPSNSDDRLRIIGTHGVIEVNEGDSTISLTTKSKVERIPFGTTGNMFVEFLSYVEGGPVPRITAEDSFYMTEVMLYARQAADEKRLVELPKRRKLKE